MRLSASQIGKLNNELKIACNEIEDLKKRLQDSSNFNRKIPELENKLALLSQEVERLNSVIEKKNAEIRALGGEIQEHQENIRLSSVQNTKLSAELNNFRMKLGETTQES